jgi:hypothetical protein
MFYNFVSFVFILMFLSLFQSHWYIILHLLDEVKTPPESSNKTWYIVVLMLRICKTLNVGIL